MDCEIRDSEGHSLGIHPRLLQPATFPPFDLYVPDEEDGRLTLFRPAGEPVYVNTWRKLEEQGIELCYVGAQHRQECLDYVEEHLDAIIEQDEMPEDQLGQWVYLLTGRALEMLMDDPDCAEHYRRVNRMVAAVVRVLARDKYAVAHMLGCAPLDYHTHFHSASVSALLGGFAYTVLEVEDPEVLGEIVLGGALHDLGKVMVPDEILHKPARLTSGEFATVTRHPGDGVQIARPFLRHQTLAQRVIVQHHENAGGDGYPDGRAGASINSFARATRVADVFDALTSNRPYGGALDRHCALNTMTSEMPGVFDERLLRRFIRYAAASFHQDGPVMLTRSDPRSGAEPPRATPALLEGPPLHSAADDTPQREPEKVDTENATEKEREAPPSVERHVRALEALAGGREDVSMMTDILGALQQAVQRYRGKPTPVPADGAGRDAAERQQRRADIEAARPLFPLVWQIDAWRARFAERAVDGQSAGRMRREILECLGVLREAILRLLHADHVEVVESAEAMEKAPTPEQAPPEQGGRVGFIYRTDGAVEVLEPPRPAGSGDRRRAG